NLVKYSPFPSQRKEALDYLASLMQTRQYASLARRELITVITEEATSDIDTRIKAAATLYLRSPLGSKERQAIQVLSDLVVHPDLSVEQQVQVAGASCRCSTAHSKERQQTVQKLSDLTQHPDLSSEQQAQVAEVLRECSLISSEEERRAARIFSRLTRYSDLS